MKQAPFLSTTLWNFLISNLVEHSMFEVSFTYKDNYFQRIKIPSIYIQDFLRVYDFLDISEFDDSKLKNVPRLLVLDTLFCVLLRRCRS